MDAMISNRSFCGKITTLIKNIRDNISSNGGVVVPNSDEGRKKRLFESKNNRYSPGYTVSLGAGENQITAAYKSTDWATFAEIKMGNFHLAYSTGEGIKLGGEGVLGPGQDILETDAKEIISAITESAKTRLDLARAAGQQNAVDKAKSALNVIK